MMPKTKPIENRKFNRADCRIESVFHDIDSRSISPLIETTVEDISLGGMRFRCNEFIPRDNRLSFRLSVPKRPVMHILAQPAWVRELPALGQYEVGARFLTLTDDEKDLIRVYFAPSQPTVPSSGI